LSFAGFRPAICGFLFFQLAPVLKEAPFARYFYYYISRGSEQKRQYFMIDNNFSHFFSPTGKRTENDCARNVSRDGTHCGRVWFSEGKLAKRHHRFRHLPKWFGNFEGCFI